MRGSPREYEQLAAVVAKDLSVEYSTLRVSRNPKSSNPLQRIGLIPSRTIKRAVQDVSFVIDRGESVGIVGRNGSGKSTLLRALCGLEMAKQGEVWTRRKPVFLGVNPALLPDRTGIENIKLGCLAMGLSLEETLDSIPRVEELADLGDAINDPINTYSSGMRSRLKFSISAAAPATDILMIDEALGTGDAAFQARSEEAMSRIIDNAGTIFFVSHVPKLVERMCTRAIWLFEGEVIMDGPSNVVPEEYRLWALAVKKHNFKEADRRIQEARASYISPHILVQ